MTIGTAYKEGLKEIWISRRGLTDKQPEEQDRFIEQEAEVIADEILKLIGLTP